MTATQTAKPTNLAQLKRYLKPGMRLASTFHGFAGAPQQRRQVVVVKYVNSVDIVFEPHPEIGGGTRPLYSRLQKADRYSFSERGYSIADETGHVFASYEYEVPA